MGSGAKTPPVHHPVPHFYFDPRGIEHTRPPGMGSNAEDPRRADLPAGPMQVQAVLPGFYDNRYWQPGQMFEIRDARKDFSFSWMTPVSGLGAEPANTATPEGAPTFIVTADHQQIVL